MVPDGDQASGRTQPGGVIEVIWWGAALDEVIKEGLFDKATLEP